jgi:hypothetical protein
MCVTLRDATLGLTTQAGWRFHPRRTHCQLYGNEPRNRANVANAMFLHIPIAPATTLTQANFLPTRGLRLLLDDMWRAAPKYQEQETLRTMSAGVTRKTVSVFDMGNYTWVAATRADPGDITEALNEVRDRRPDRHPQIGAPLIEFYLRTWPHDALAIGCFNQAAGQATEPVALEYVPQNWDVLRMPAVDAHGEIPDFTHPAVVNHRLIVGTAEFGAGGRVTYRELGQMDPRLAEVLPGRVVGAELRDIPMANGDFYVDFGRFTDRADPSGPGGGAKVLRAHGPELTERADRIPVLLG